MKKMKKRKLFIVLVLAFIMTISIPISALAHTDNLLLEPEEVHSILASITDDNNSAPSSQQVVIPSSINNLARASDISIGLGSGKDIFGREFIEIRVDGVSTSIVNITLVLTVFHVPLDGGDFYFTETPVVFYGLGLLGSSQRFYYTDWASAGFQGYASYSNGNTLVIPFIMTVRP